VCSSDLVSVLSTELNALYLKHNVLPKRLHRFACVIYR